VPVVKDKDDYTRARWQVDAHAFWRSSGDRHLTPDELAAMGPDQLAKVFTEQTLKQVYDYESHVRIGEASTAAARCRRRSWRSRPGRTTRWSGTTSTGCGRSTASSRSAAAQHICPLQIDIVDRLITATQRGRLVLDPFSGLGTVPVRALALGRAGSASS
jgi:hypothetical protein